MRQSSRSTRITKIINPKIPARMTAIFKCPCVTGYPKKLSCAPSLKFRLLLVCGDWFGRRLGEARDTSQSDELPSMGLGNLRDLRNWKSSIGEGNSEWGLTLGCGTTCARGLIIPNWGDLCTGVTGDVLVCLVFSTWEIEVKLDSAAIIFDIVVSQNLKRYLRCL